MRHYKLDRIIKESIDYVKTREIVKDIVREELDRYAGMYITEKKKKKKNSSIEMGKAKNTVKRSLKDKKFKNSVIAYELWPDMDKDTARSLFSKKVSGKPDNDGNIRNFTDEEIVKLTSIIRHDK